MPVVPFTPGQSQSQAPPPPAPKLDPTFALIAAAQMHSEGRLVAQPQQKDAPSGRPVPPVRG